MAVTTGEAPWWQRAACQNLPTGWFISTSRADLARGLAVCATCSVVAECGSWADRLPQPHALAVICGGKVYGGLPPRGRPAVQTDQSATVNALPAS